HQIGRERRDLFLGLLARRGGADDVGGIDVTEQRVEPPQCERFVIDQQNPERRHAPISPPRCASGRRTRTTKPRSRRFASRLPAAPNNVSSRWRILASPTPVPGRSSASATAPSSSTDRIS